MVLSLPPTAVLAADGEDVAKVDGKTYQPLQGAIDAAEDGATVKLLSDIDLVTKQLTLDMNGKKLYNTKDLWEQPNDEENNNWSLISVRKGGDLTITGDGTLDAKENDCYAIDLQDETSKCTIENGTFVGNVTAVYVHPGTLIINGGKFSIKQLNTNGVLDSYGVTINCYDADYKAGTAKVTITGGTFSHFNPADNKAKGAGTNFCPSGYEATASGNNYIVSAKSSNVAAIGNIEYATLADAIVAAGAGDTVTLPADTAEDFTLDNQDIVLDLNAKTLNATTLVIKNGSGLALTSSASNVGKLVANQVWVLGGNSANETTKYSIGKNVEVSGNFPLIIEGGTNLETSKGTYGFSKVEVAGTIKATSSGIWVMGNLGNGAESMEQMTMSSNIVDIKPTAKIIGVGDDNLGVTVMGLATVNIAEGAEISGSEGIFVKRGTVNINGGSISGNRSDFELSPDANNNGAEEVGVALVISSTYNYSGTIEVNINGGTFTSEHGNAIYVGHSMNGSTPNTFVNGYALNITDGNFNSAAGKESLNIAEKIDGDNASCKTTVTGGYFTSDPTTYVADGFHTAASNKTGYTYMVVEGTPDDTTIIVSDNVAADDADTVKDKDDVKAVIDKASVENVAKALTDDAQDKLIADAGVKASELDESDTVTIVVNVAVKAVASDLSNTNNATLTFEADPTATVYVNGEKKGEAQGVSNDMLNGSITVTLPLPEGFTPKQITHKSDGYRTEYYLDHYERGAKHFTIDENNCAVFDITHFSTFVLSGTQTYVAPSRPSSSIGSTITVGKTENGTITVSPKTASKGDTVTITVKPADGYELGSLTATDANGSTLALTDLGNGKYSFTMPDGKVEVSGTFVKKSAQTFVDVPENAYYAPAVNWAVEKGVTEGTSATTFSPDAACTRAQIVTFLYRAAGSPAVKSTVNPFTDVTASDYYYNAVLWAVENGITTGTSETTFSPNESCTRAQCVTFLYRAVGSAATAKARFTDVSADAYYAPAVDWAVEKGVTTGTSATTFFPDDACTRAQIVTFLYRAAQVK